MIPIPGGMDRSSGRAETAAAGVLLVVCACLRPDVAAGLVVLGAVFVVLERRWPIVEQRILRGGWQTDVVHFVVDQVAAAIVVTALAWVLVPWLEPLLPDLDALLSSPWRLAVAAGLGEAAGYWGHRAMHQVPALWRLHAVHHSSPAMDWLAPNRRHVLDTALSQALSVVPLLAMGLSPPVVVSAFVLRRAQGLFVHANLRIRLPGLRWIVATPEFHHWHHSADPAHHDRNFAGQCPIMDWMFGTLYLSADSWPASYGLGPGSDPVPAGYLARLRWPFRDVRLRQVRPVRLVAAVTVGVGFTSGATAISAALDRNPMPWAYRCRMEGEKGDLAVQIGTRGVIVTRDGADPDQVTVRHVDGDPIAGVGIRVIGAGEVPMTLAVAPGRVGSRTTASAVSAEGSWAGTCIRGSDPPDG